MRKELNTTYAINDEITTLKPTSKHTGGDLLHQLVLDTEYKKKVLTGGY